MSSTLTEDEWARKGLSNRSIGDARWTINDAPSERRDGLIGRLLGRPWTPWWQLRILLKLGKELTTLVCTLIFNRDHVLTSSAETRRYSQTKAGSARVYRRPSVSRGPAPHGVSLPRAYLNIDAKQPADDYIPFHPPIIGLHLCKPFPASCCGYPRQSLYPALYPQAFLSGYLS